MKQRPLNPVKKESLWGQVDQRVEQRVVEEVYSPWSFPLAPVLKRNSREVRWAIAHRQMNAIPREDVSSPDCRHVPQDKGWLIRDLGTDDHGSPFSGCFLFSPSLGGHDYWLRNISGRWPEATPPGEKLEWLVANFPIDSSALLRREMVKMPLVPALKKNSGEIRWAVHYWKQNAVRKEEAFPFPNIVDGLSRLSASKISSALDVADASRLAAEGNQHLTPSGMLCYRKDTVRHPSGAKDQLRILREVLSAFGAAGLQVSSGRTQLLKDHLKYLDCEVSAQRITGPPAYTMVIWQWPLIDTREALHALLSKCEYYRGFIADYTTLLAPLVRYTKQEQHDRIPIMDKDLAALDAFRLMDERTAASFDSRVPEVLWEAVHPGHQTFASTLMPLEVYCYRSQAIKNVSPLVRARRLQPLETHLRIDQRGTPHGNICLTMPCLTSFSFCANR